MKMRRTLLLTLVGLLAALPANAWVAQQGATSTTTQVLIGGSTTASANNGDSYYPIGYFHAAMATSSVIPGAFPFSGTLKKLTFYTQTAPVSSQTWVATIYKNGSSTGLTCTVSSSSSPAGVCTVSVDVTFIAGDYFHLRTHPLPTGGPTASIPSFSIDMQPDNANDTVIFAAAAASAFSTSSSLFLPVGFAPNTNTSAISRRISLPDTGTVDKFYIHTNAPGTTGSGKSYTYTVNKNGASTALTKTLSEITTADSDTVNSASVTGPSGSTAGDDLEIGGAPTGTPTAGLGGFGLRYVLTALNYAFIQGANQLTDSTTAVNYLPIAGGLTGLTTTEAPVKAITHSQTFNRIAAKVSVAPGAGKSRKFTLRVNGADSALTCTISGTATACTADITVAVNDNDILSTADDPTAGSTPAAAVPSVSYRATR